jgi:hypothetical protein
MSSSRQRRMRCGRFMRSRNPLTDVQAWMGHRSITTTMRYVHYVPQHDAAARLTAAFALDDAGAEVGTEVGTELPTSSRN